MANRLLRRGPRNDGREELTGTLTEAEERSECSIRIAEGRHTMTSPLSPPLVPSAPSIRIFQPDADEDPQTPKNTRTISPGVLYPTTSWTLRVVYEAHVLPELTADQKGTKEGYSGALNHWESRTENPGVDRVDDDVRKTFQGSMERDPRDYSPDTIRKQWRYLSHIMRVAKAKGLMAEVPKLQRLPTVDPDVRIVPDEHLERFYLACALATWPQLDCMSAPDWWRGSVVIWRIYGLRCCELHNRLPWRSERTKHDLKKDWPSPGVYEDPVCPMKLIRPLGIRSPYGWLVYTPKKQTWAKPSPLVLPLHPVARAHLDRIRGDRQFVFPRSKANKAFNAQWDRLLEAAHIPDDDRFLRHDLRRTCEDGYGSVGQHVTGHAKRSVSTRYYRNFAKRTAQAIRKIKLPPSFSAILESPAENTRQKVLF